MVLAEDLQHGLPVGVAQVGQPLVEVLSHGGNVGLDGPNATQALNHAKAVLCVWGGGGEGRVIRTQREREVQDADRMKLQRGLGVWCSKLGRKQNIHFPW